MNVSLIPSVYMQDGYYHVVNMVYCGGLCAKLVLKVSYMGNLHMLYFDG